MTAPHDLVTLDMLDREGGIVAWITIDNPPLNLFTRDAMQGLIARVAAATMEPYLRAVVLTGAGERAFIAGADVKEMATLTRDTAAEFITLLHRACDSLRSLPMPVIARMAGPAFGAGVEIAASCDVRVAVSSATFGMPEVRLGIPSVIEAALLPGLIGWGRTRYLVLTGDTIDAEDACAWGLIDQVVDPEELDFAVEAWLEPILAAGPQAIRAQKALLREWEALPLAAAIEAGIQRFAQSWDSDEPARLMRAFLERKRAP
jgi:enoyl-CoA hydratase/carnithine racemase